jgi:hypothetical protein
LVAADAASIRGDKVRSILVGLLRLFLGVSILAKLLRRSASGGEKPPTQKKEEKKMRFLGYTLASEAETPTEPPSPDLYEKMGRFVEEAVKAGVIVATGGIAPTSEGVRISLKNDEYTVVDGPFVEAKELVGGWALMECRDLPEAVEWSKRFLGVLGEGEVRVRPVLG